MIWHSLGTLLSSLQSSPQHLFCKWVTKDINCTCYPEQIHNTTSNKIFLPCITLTQTHTFTKLIQNEHHTQQWYSANITVRETKCCLFFLFILVFLSLFYGFMFCWFCFFPCLFVYLLQWNWMNINKMQKHCSDCDLTANK